MFNSRHKTTYTWPNPAFPFRKYFDHPNLRIFIIENIHHNWNWLRDHSRRFQNRDHFLVYCGWYFDDWFVSQDLAVFESLELDKEKFFFLFNSAEERDRYLQFGFHGEVINQNAWLDAESVMKPLMNVIKKYNAIYVGRLTPFKRHELACEVTKLALVVGDLHGEPESLTIPPHVYRNQLQLSPVEVCTIINESNCGLILSAVEGACFASSEYLLCGVPVVSTYSMGGRDVWYTDYNSIQTDASAKAVKDAVDYFVNNPRDPLRIRNEHIAQAEGYKTLFIQYLNNMFMKYEVTQDAVAFFRETYIHKLRKSENPDFLLIWPSA